MCQGSTFTQPHARRANPIVIDHAPSLILECSRSLPRHAIKSTVRCFVTNVSVAQALHVGTPRFHPYHRHFMRPHISATCPAPRHIHGRTDSIRDERLAFPCAYSCGFSPALTAAQAFVVQLLFRRHAPMISDRVKALDQRAEPTITRTQIANRFMPDAHRRQNRRAIHANRSNRFAPASDTIRISWRYVASVAFDANIETRLRPARQFGPSVCCLPCLASADLSDGQLAASKCVAQWAGVHIDPDSTPAALHPASLIVRVLALLWRWSGFVGWRHIYSRNVQIAA